MPTRNPSLTLTSFLIVLLVRANEASKRAREFEFKGKFEVACKEDG
jgi:hypothetical protein